MSTSLRNVIIILIALALLGTFLRYITYGGGTTSEEAQQQFMEEIQGFDAFDEHRELLVAVIEREAPKVFDAVASRPRLTSPRRLDWDIYRGQMYQRLISALKEAGEKNAAIRLERFRARQ